MEINIFISPYTFLLESYGGILSKIYLAIVIGGGEGVTDILYLEGYPRPVLNSNISQSIKLAYYPRDPMSEMSNTRGRSSSPKRPNVNDHIDEEDVRYESSSDSRSRSNSPHRSNNTSTTTTTTETTNAPPSSTTTGTTTRSRSSSYSPPRNNNNKYSSESSSSSESDESYVLRSRYNEGKSLRKYEKEIFTLRKKLAEANHRLLSRVYISFLTLRYFEIGSNFSIETRIGQSRDECSNGIARQSSINNRCE